MIHNKYFEILNQFLGDYTKEIHGRSLVGKVGLSQKGVAIALDELEKQSILKSRIQGTLRLYRINVEHSEMRDIIVEAELMRKVRFLSMHRKIAHLFASDGRIVGVFGSYAKGTEKKDSDLDIFIVGEKMKVDYGPRGKSYDLDISVKYFTPSEWKSLLKARNSLCREIAENHIIIFGAESFVNSLWRYFYGIS